MWEYRPTSRYEKRIILDGVENEAAKKLAGPTSGVLRDQCDGSHPAVSSHPCDGNYGMHCCT